MTPEEREAIKEKIRGRIQSNQGGQPSPYAPDKRAVLNRIRQRRASMEGQKIAEQDAVKEQERMSAIGYEPTFKSSPDDSPLQAGAKAVGNLPKSAFMAGKGLWDLGKSLISEPKETLGAFKDIAVGGVSRLAEKTGLREDTGTTEQEEKFGAVASSFKSRYGSLENLQRTATEDPFGFGAELYGGLRGAAGIVGKGRLADNLTSTAAKPITKPASVIGSTLKKRALPNILAYTSDRPATAFKLLLDKRREVSASLKKGVTPEVSLEKMRGGVRTLRTKLSKEWEDGANVLINQFQGQRMLLPLNEWKVLTRVAEDFPNVKLPQNPRNVSLKETMDALKSLNELYSKRIVREMPQGISVRAATELLRQRMTNTFGGPNGPVDQFYKNYSTKKEVFDNARSLFDPYTRDPKKMATQLGRLRAMFADNKGAYLDAIVELEKSTGLDLITDAVAVQFKDILPDARSTITAGGGLTGSKSVFQKGLDLLLFPLTSPRVSSLILRGIDSATDSLSDLNNLRIPQGVKEASGRFEDFAKEKGISAGLSIQAVTGFEGFDDLSTKLLEKLKGRSTVSRQFIEDLTNSPDLKQPERDLIRRMLDEEVPASPGKVYYHYTNADFTDFKTNKQLQDEGIEIANPVRKDSAGIYFFDKKADGGFYGKNRIEAYLDINNPKKVGKDFNISSLTQKQIDYYKSQGYDALESPKETVVFDPSQITTKAQLEKQANQISVPDFANKVKSELLPLERVAHDNPKYSGGENMFSTRYENITLPDELRGPVANYSEHTYESPIKTSAGSVHFGASSDSYFAHSRVEDLPATGNKGRMIPPRNMSPEGRAAFDKRATELADTGDTRRVIEIQSDLFQKGRLEREFGAERKGVLENHYESADNPKYVREAIELDKSREALEPYRNTWHERIIREEVKQAAKDGKTKLQFPVGETAMKIEGLGDTQAFTLSEPGAGGRFQFLKPDELKVGLSVKNADAASQDWIITDVLGDGKFKAVPRDTIMNMEDELAPLGYLSPDDVDFTDARVQEALDGQIAGTEQFDISGKVDTENPIYKFYEKEVGRYLKNKYGATRVKDAQGVEWWEIDLKGKGFDKAPVEAFGLAPLAGAMAQDE